MLSQFGVVNAWAYILGAALVIIAPGPNSLYVLKSATTDGKVCARVAMLAVLAGDSILIALACLGLAALLQTHEMIFLGIRVFGAFFLGLIAVGALRCAVRPKRKPTGEEIAPQVSKWAEREGGPSVGSAFVTALVLSLTNPKAILFYLAFFMQFVDPGYPEPWVTYLTLAAILQIFSFLWLTMLTEVGGALLRRIARYPVAARLGYAFLGIVFLCFAAKLLMP